VSHTLAPNFIETTALFQPDRPAVIDAYDNRVRTYSGLAYAIDAVAAWAYSNTSPRDVIGVYMDSRLESPEMVLGLIKSGRKVLPLDRRVPRPFVDMLLAQVGANPEPVGLNTGTLDPSSPHYTAILDAEYIESSPDALPWSGGFITLSSGTEGRPTAGYRSWKNTVPSVLPHQAQDMGMGGTVRITQPWGNASSLMTSVMAMSAASTLVLDREKQTGRRLVDVVRAYGVTALVAGPVLQARLLGEGAALPTLQTVISGAAPLTIHHQEEWLRRFPGVALWDACSSTEIGTMFTRKVTFPAVSHGNTPSNKRFEVRNAAEDGIGEIWAHGADTIEGTYDQGVYTPIPDRWVTSGDYGRFDGRTLVLEGRRSDKAIISGHTVYTPQVEALIRTLGGTQDCAVAVVPDPVRGQALRVFYVGDLTPRDLASTLRATLPGFMVPEPDAIVPVDAIPLSAAGKVLKRELVTS
jgi:acyl-CoA synthetase (AMP-forming)/AMP-acid ligase II